MFTMMAMDHIVLNVRDMDTVLDFYFSDPEQRRIEVRYYDEESQ